MIGTGTKTTGVVMIDETRIENMNLSIIILPPFIDNLFVRRSGNCRIGDIQ